MFSNIATFESIKRMRDHIEMMYVGTVEVRDNKRQILVFHYEAFMTRPKERIIEIFKRFNKVISELQLHGKIYNNKLNIKFFLTVPNHLEYIKI